jgi:hypothetical protein
VIANIVENDKEEFALASQTKTSQFTKTSSKYVRSPLSSVLMTFFLKKEPSLFTWDDVDGIKIYESFSDSDKLLKIWFSLFRMFKNRWWGKFHLQSFYLVITDKIQLILYITNLVCYTYFHWFFNPQSKWLKWLNVPIQNKVFLSYLILIASIHDTTGHLIWFCQRIISNTLKNRTPFYTINQCKLLTSVFLCFEITYYTTYNTSRAVAVRRCFQFHPVMVLKRRILST